MLTEKEIEEFARQNLQYTYTHSVAVEIENLLDGAFLDAIRRWAEANGLDEVYLLDSDTMMEVFKMGMEQYRRTYGDLRKPLCKYMEFRDGRQVGGEWRTT